MRRIYAGIAKARNQESARDRVRRLVAAGLCRDCGLEPPVTTRCESCRRIHNEDEHARKMARGRSTMQTRPLTRAQRRALTELQGGKLAHGDERTIAILARYGLVTATKFEFLGRLTPEGEAVRARLLAESEQRRSA